MMFGSGREIRMNRICSTRAELCTGSRSVSNKLKSEVSRGVKIRSHLASKSTFASVFASNFNIVSVITLTLMQRMDIEPILCICILHFVIVASIITARKRSLRRLCFYTCLSFLLFMGGDGILACLAGGIPACLAGLGGVYSSMPCRFPGPHPRGKLRGLAGGSPDGHPGGVSQHAPSRTPRRLLLRAVCILLECILVFDNANADINMKCEQVFHKELCYVCQHVLLLLAMQFHFQ